MSTTHGSAPGASDDNALTIAAEAVLSRSFVQPAGQQLPADFLDMLAELDRSKRGAG
jgi:hypothetical protein